MLTGSHGPVELLLVAADSRPTHLGYDLRDLLRPARVVQTGTDRACCGGQTVTRTGRQITLIRRPEDRVAAVDVLWAAAQLSWPVIDAGEVPEVSRVVEAVGPLLAAANLG